MKLKQRVATVGGIVTLANGWQLALPDLSPDTRLPITVEARKVA